MGVVVADRVFQCFKGRVHCFSMQVLKNKCFLLNLKKILVQIRLIVY